MCPLARTEREPRATQRRPRGVRCAVGHGPRAPRGRIWPTLSHAHRGAPPTPARAARQIWLLPPIILDAGYTMQRGYFFGQFGAILQFAFVGTFVSALVVGGVVFTAGQLGWCHALGGLDSLTFGAIISATDPVTVLAVFSRLGVDQHLFSIVFGESVMNDAVAIVLCETLLSFRSTHCTPRTVLDAFGVFAGIFAGSVATGVVTGVLSALTFKALGLVGGEHVITETVLCAVLAWTAYYVAEALGMSGIVAILFCGIVMAHYTIDNLSAGARAHTALLFKSLATFAEAFIFVYLGFAVFAYPIYQHTVWRLVGVAIVACLLGRALNIFPNTWLINACRGGGDAPRGAAGGAARADAGPISSTCAGVIWFSGLRGGVAFALATYAYSRNVFPEHGARARRCAPVWACRRAVGGGPLATHTCGLTTRATPRATPRRASGDGLAILQATLLIAVLSIFVLGGSVEWLAVRLDLFHREPEAPPAMGEGARAKLSRLEELDECAPERARREEPRAARRWSRPPRPQSRPIAQLTACRCPHRSRARRCAPCVRRRYIRPLLTISAVHAHHERFEDSVSALAADDECATVTSLANAPTGGAGDDAGLRSRGERDAVVIELT